MPKPGPEHERLGVLAGAWEGEETLHPNEWTVFLEGKFRRT